MFFHGCNLLRTRDLLCTLFCVLIIVFFVYHEPMLYEELAHILLYIHISIILNNCSRWRWPFFLLMFHWRVLHFITHADEHQFVAHSDGKLFTHGSAHLLSLHLVFGVSASIESSVVKERLALCLFLLVPAFNFSF